MKTYRIITSTVINDPKWWIDFDMIKPEIVEAEGPEAAIDLFIDNINDDYFVEVSKTAKKNKKAAYVDLKAGGFKQVGYVITASTLMEKSNYGGFVKKYIELWADIEELKDAFQGV